MITRDNNDYLVEETKKSNHSFIDQYSSDFGVDGIMTDFNVVFPTKTICIVGKYQDM